MKKKLLLVLMLIAAVVVMPRVHAEEDKTITLGAVTDITNEDTLKSGHKNDTVSHNEDYSVVTITYDEATFRLLGEGSQESNSDGRTAGYAWIGLDVAQATNATKYVVTFNGGDPDDEQDAAEIKDFIGFNATELEEAAKAGKNLEFTYEIEWKGENGVEPVTQSITIVIMPKGITLQAQNYDSASEGEKEVWNAAKYEEVRPAEVTVKVIKDGKEVELEEPVSYALIDTKRLTDDKVAAMKAILSDDNLELVGLYTDKDLKTEFDATKDITSDITIYVVYKTKAAESEEEAPDTIDNAVMYIALAGASILVASGVAVYYKRFN